MGKSSFKRFLRGEKKPPADKPWEKPRDSVNTEGPSKSDSQSSDFDGEKDARGSSYSANRILGEKDAPDDSDDASRQDASHETHEDAASSAPRSAGGIMPEIYADNDVVKLFAPLTGLQRYKLEIARKSNNKGLAWDAVGKHVGMTKDWVWKYALENKVSIHQVAALKTVQPDDGVVSCKVVGTFPNMEKVSVKVIATGEMAIATVPPIDRPSMIDGHMMSLGEVFDARYFGADLHWTRDLNDCIYYRP